MLNLRQFCDDLKARLGLDEFRVSQPRRDTLQLDMITVAAKSTGAGSAAMAALTDLADQTGLRVELATAGREDRAVLGTTSRLRLVRFYKRHGFRRVRGSARRMFRDPVDKAHPVEVF